jgi:hypothetical protein
VLGQFKNFSSNILRSTYLNEERSVSLKVPPSFEMKNLLGMFASHSNIFSCCFTFANTVLHEKLLSFQNICLRSMDTPIFLHRYQEALMPEWSKGVHSSCTIVRCVGSNPT